MNNGKPRFVRSIALRLSRRLNPKKEKSEEETRDRIHGQLLGLPQISKFTAYKTTHFTLVSLKEWN